MELVLFTDGTLDQDQYRLISDRTGARLITDPGEIKDGTLVLSAGKDGVKLTFGKMEVKGDFSGMYARIRKNNLNGELLVKAARIPGISPSEITVADATAGLGEDSFLLAAAGYRVLLFEKDPVIYLLLEDALKRAVNDPAIHDIAARMNCMEADSKTALGSITEKPDIVFLDPMFPARQKSGLVKKKFQLLHFLEKPCEDEKEMMDAAFGADPCKIIIKRPLKAAVMADVRPTYSLTGKSIRYDVIVVR